MFGLDPKKMNAMMRQMGISQENIPASRVVIEKEDGNIVIKNPLVTKVRMSGQESFQISGEISESSGIQELSEEDIKTIMEKTGCSEKEARKALEKTGDLAEAIMELSE